MAVVGVVQVRCPECDVAVPITTEIASTRHEGSILITALEPDLTDVVAHVWTHEAPSDGLG
ncbi:hypothetical protein ACFW2V_02550 [Streptomyces sp. NPDC058947]|uniref:hypothetical protein n=1 Tax=Streptomyces sp. NPDC058947 TaxID=3346675 RepID=UPI0036D12691